MIEIVELNILISFNAWVMGTDEFKEVAEQLYSQMMGWV